METSTRLAIDGVDMFVVSEGSGPPVFVLGGPWFGHYYLRQLHRELAKHCYVIAYDARGAGQSSALTQNQITIAGHLRDLDQLRHAMNVEKMNIVGHSMGALVSLLYAAQHPATMASLVLLHPGPPFDQELQETLHRAFASGHLPHERARLKELSSSPAFASRDPKTHEEYFKILYSPFFMDRANLTQLDFAFTETTAQYALEAEERLLADILEQDPTAKVSRVKCPTLVVHAEHDLIPEAFSRQLADGIPGAEYLRLPGLGHFAFLEDPSRSIPPIIEFLTRTAR